MTIDYERDEREEDTAAARRAPSLSGLARTATLARQVAEAANGSNDQVSAASPIGGLIQVAESFESGLTSKERDERMERFPELRDVELPKGAAAQFPELAPEPAKDKSAEADEEYERR